MSVASSISPTAAVSSFQDGPVFVAVGNPRLWTQFCAAVDARELEHDPRFATNDDRVAHRDLLNAELEQHVAHMSRHELIERLLKSRLSPEPGPARADREV